MAHIGYYRQTWEKIDAWLKNIKDGEKVGSTLRTQWESLKQMLHDRKCLNNDFQIVIDTEGKMYNFDLDRCWGRTFKGRDDSKKVLRRAFHFIEYVINSTLMLPAVKADDIPAHSDY